MDMELNEIGALAKKASYELLKKSSAEKNKAILSIADALSARADEIICANKTDLENAAAAGMKESMADRLKLTKERIDGIAEGVRQVAALEDPIGETVRMWKNQAGLEIGQRRVPIGVIAIIYESRPNVTADAAVLCLKTSNAVILRGGKEAINSNKAIVKIMQEAAENAGIPAGSINLIEDTSRETAKKLMQLREYVDLLIPRGGKNLIRSVVDNASVPVIETGAGNCHIYVDEKYDKDMAVNIIVNAKTSRPSVCNAAESLLVATSAAEEFLPEIFAALREKGVEIRGCGECMRICPDIKAAEEEDYYTEYNDYIISVKVVGGVEEAIEHINRHNTKHSEAIVTTDYANARRFLNEVDAAAVYVNASTRFTDGFEFGFGAEIGISTQKIHARGPMGLKELTSMKYIVYGEGQIR